MRFLVDKNLSYRVAGFLREGGYDATHVDEIDLGAAEDIDILTFAVREQLIIDRPETDTDQATSAAVTSRLGTRRAFLPKETTRAPPLPPRGEGGHGREGRGLSPC